MLKVDERRDEGETTQYGFTWGPVEVQRCTAFRHKKGIYRILTVERRGKKLSGIDIYISPTGKIRVFKAGTRKEMK